MSDNRTERRKRNGKRLDGRGLAIQVAQEVEGMMLAQAFVTIRSAGLELQIFKHDGVPRPVPDNKRDDRVMVNVVQGFIKKSWAA
jgi:hypothetical protein